MGGRGASQTIWVSGSHGVRRLVKADVDFQARLVMEDTQMRARGIGYDDRVVERPAPSRSAVRVLRSYSSPVPS
jgi:hypothetical protein